MPKLKNYDEIINTVNSIFTLLEKNLSQSAEISNIKTKLIHLLDKYNANDKINISSLVNINELKNIFETLNNASSELNLLKTKFFLPISSLYTLLNNQVKELHPYIFNFENANIPLPYKSILFFINKFSNSKIENLIEPLEELKNILDPDNLLTSICDEKNIQTTYTIALKK